MRCDVCGHLATTRGMMVRRELRPNGSVTAPSGQQWTTWTVVVTKVRCGRCEGQETCKQGSCGSV